MEKWNKMIFKKIASQEWRKGLKCTTDVFGIYSVSRGIKSIQILIRHRTKLVFPFAVMWKIHPSGEMAS